MSNRNNGILKSILGFSFPAWLNALLGFLVIPIFTRLFLPEELGKFNLFVTYSTLIYSVSLLGLNQGYMRFFNEVPGRNDRTGLQTVTIGIAMLSSAGFAILILAMWQPLSTAVVGTSSFLIALCLAMVVISNVFLSLKNAQYRMEGNLLLYCCIAILVNLCTKGTYLGAVVIDRTGQTAIILYACSLTILALAYAIPRLRQRKSSQVYWGKSEISPLLKFSIPLLPVTMLSQLNAALPKLLMNQYLTYTDIGIYSSAYSVVSIVSLVQAGINIFWPPFVYENYKKSQDMLCRAHEIAVFAMVAFGLAVLLFQDVLYLIIGENYRSSQQFFALLLCSPIFYTIAETTGVGINIAKKSYLNLITYGVGAILTLGLSVLLLPKIGLYGAAIAVAISAFAMFTIRTIIGERYYTVVRKRLKTFGVPALFIAIAVLNALFSENMAIRFALNLASILLMCFLYKKELSILLGFAKSAIVKKRTNNSQNGEHDE